jgi:hypothetical protein
VLMASGRIPGPPPNPPERKACLCRHNAGGMNYDVLQDCAANPHRYPMFNHVRYTTPCKGMGSWEAGKTPGLVAYDVGIKAARYLAWIGRGDINQHQGRDFTYDINQYSPDPETHESQGSSVTTDSQSSINLANILDTVRLQENFEGDEWFEEEDFTMAVQEALEGIKGPPSPGSVTAPSGLSTSSHDSDIQSSSRVSTKMRAATLAYLCQFADQPLRLREEFRRLRSDRTICVLHLCGCGLSSHNSAGTRYLGCSEPTHLRLGLQRENAFHASYHKVLQQTQPDGYAEMCDLHHRRVNYAEDIF